MPTGITSDTKRRPQRTAMACRSRSAATPWLGIVVVALVICGSLAPFRFDPVLVGAVGLGNLTKLTWLLPGTEDAIVNLVVYLPVGFLIARRLRPAVRWTTTVALAGIVGGLLSVAVEVTQTMMPARYASWTDVVLNLVSSMIGAAGASLVTLFARWVVTRVRASLTGSPFATAGLILTLGLIVHGATPFDVITNGDEFRESLNGTQWLPFIERKIDCSAGATPNPYASILSAMGSVGAFSVLGVVMALAYRRSGQSARSSLIGAVAHGLVVAVLIETIQLFIRSRVFDTVDLLTAGLGTGIGAWFAMATTEQRGVVLRRGVPGPGEKRQAPADPVLFISVLVLGQIAFAAATALAPLDLSLAHIDSSRAYWIPLSAQIKLPFATALGRLASTLLVSTFLAASLALFQWQRSGRIRWMAVAVIVVLTSLLCELVQLCSLSRVTDLTQPVAALAAVLGCHALYRRLAVPPWATASQET